LRGKNTLAQVRLSPYTHGNRKGRIKTNDKENYLFRYKDESPMDL